MVKDPQLESRVSRLETTVEFLKKDQEELDKKVEKMATKEDLLKLEEYLEKKVLPELIKFNSYVNRGKGAGMALVIIGAIISAIVAAVGDALNLIFN